MGLQALLASGLSSLDLRMTNPNGGSVLPVEKARAGRPAEELVLDEATLPALGSCGVPRHLWQACQRFSCWVEPALVTEWIRLMRSGARRGEQVSGGQQIAIKGGPDHRP